MKSFNIKITLLLFFLLLSSTFASNYAVVVSQTTYNMPDWQRVVDSLANKHQAHIFQWTSNVSQVQSALTTFQPDFICFVGRPATEINASFVQTVHQLTRNLDSDPYGDAIWGIITGYNADDAMRVLRYDSLSIKTVLGGTASTWDYGIMQGISTFEASSNRLAYKFPDGSRLDTVWPERCPTDRCTLLINYLNHGIDESVPDRPRIRGAVDMFVTSGHASEWVWQLHYPNPSPEGYFQSSSGQVYATPAQGNWSYLNSPNPKIYFPVGNCLIGDVADNNCMVLGWFHSGGAIQMTGYVVSTYYGYMLWGLPAYYHGLQNRLDRKSVV
jgi:zinc protease